MTSKSYKGYSLFTDVGDNALRAFNRIQMAFNIREDMGTVEYENYLNEIKKEGELPAMYVMSLYVKENGMATVKRQLTEGMS